MDRRRFLAALAGTTGAVAGCAERLGADTNRGQDQDGPGGKDGTAGNATTGEPVGTSGETVDRTRLARRGNPPTICQEETDEDPGIYAVTDPAFGTGWAGVSVADRYRPVGVEDLDGLGDDHTVVGLADGDAARAYPLGILWYHEIVNTDGRAASTDDPVMVTYCPLCSSGLVASRAVEGTASEFLVSGLLWKAPRIQTGAAEADDEVFGAEQTGGQTPGVRNNGNLVMYDRATESYWSQILATAICGPHEGSELAVVPSTVTTWGAWRERHPETEVLLPPPHSGTTDPDEN